jgi:hypothetical protein
MLKTHNTLNWLPGCVSYSRGYPVESLKPEKAAGEHGQSRFRRTRRTKLVPRVLNLFPYQQTENRNTWQFPQERNLCFKTLAATLTAVICLFSSGSVLANEDHTGQSPLALAASAEISEIALGDTFQPTVELVNKLAIPLPLRFIRPVIMVPEIWDLQTGKRLLNTPTYVYHQTSGPDEKILAPGHSVPLLALPIEISATDNWASRANALQAFWKAAPGRYRLRYSVSLNRFLPSKTGRLMSNDIFVRVVHQRNSAIPETLSQLKTRIMRIQPSLFLVSQQPHSPTPRKTAKLSDIVPLESVTRIETSLDEVSLPSDVLLNVLSSGVSVDYKSLPPLHLAPLGHVSVYGAADEHYDIHLFLGVTDRVRVASNWFRVHTNVPAHLVSAVTSQIFPGLTRAALEKSFVRDGGLSVPKRCERYVLKAGSSGEKVVKVNIEFDAGDKVKRVSPPYLEAAFYD